MGVKIGASVCNVSGSTAAGDFSACPAFGTGFHGPKVNQTTSEWKKMVKHLRNTSVIVRVIITASSHPYPLTHAKGIPPSASG